MLKNDVFPNKIGITSSLAWWKSSCFWSSLLLSSASRNCLRTAAVTSFLPPSPNPHTNHESTGCPPHTLGQAPPSSRGGGSISVSATTRSSTSLFRSFHCTKSTEVPQVKSPGRIWARRGKACLHQDQGRSGADSGCSSLALSNSRPLGRAGMAPTVTAGIAALSLLDGLACESCKEDKVRRDAEERARRRDRGNYYAHPQPDHTHHMH